MLLNIKIASFVLDSIRVAHVLDLGYMTPSLRRSKAPLIHRSAAPPIKTITLSGMNTERSAFFLRVGLPFIPSLCFVKIWSVCCRWMRWNSYISNGHFCFFGFPEWVWLLMGVFDFLVLFDYYCACFSLKWFGYDGNKVKGMSKKIMLVVVTICKKRRGP